MSVWTIALRLGFGTALLLLAFPVNARGADPVGVGLMPQSPPELRRQAEAAERAGDWESAFTFYCRLYIADRTVVPELREKLAGSFRRVQQLRRHRDPAFQHFAASLAPADALTLYAELMAKVPLVYADPARSAPQVLWLHGIEEFDRALGNPAFVAAFIENPSPERIESLRMALRVDWAAAPFLAWRDVKTRAFTLRLLVLLGTQVFLVSGIRSPYPYHLGTALILLALLAGVALAQAESRRPGLAVPTAVLAAVSCSALAWSTSDFRIQSSIARYQDHTLSVVTRVSGPDEKVLDGCGLAWHRH